MFRDTEVSEDGPHYGRVGEEREDAHLTVATRTPQGVDPVDTGEELGPATARAAVDQVLAGHDPYPALAVDRHWTLCAANAAVGRLIAGVTPAQLQPPVNVLRLSLHPDGLAPRIANLVEWRSHLLERLRRQVEATADPALADLLDVLRGLPMPRAPGPPRPVDHAAGAVAVPLRLVTDAGTLSFISTTTVFGTPVDITLSELAIEAFFPADAATADTLRRMAGPAR